MDSGSLAINLGFAASMKLSALIDKGQQRNDQLSAFAWQESFIKALPGSLAVATWPNKLASRWRSHGDNDLLSRCSVVALIFG
jgi:hypothetical protein